METTFQCWICGEDVNSIFSIKISNTANVKALRDDIKAFRSHRFRDVTASNLKLYSFPSHDDLELALQRWTPVGKKELSPGKKLSKVVSEHLIVVEEPSFDITLNCWVRGRLLEYFPVKISITETVGALKKAIKNENLESFRGLDAKDLTLFKVSLAFEDGSLEGVVEALTISSLGKRLQSSQRLSAIFGPKLSDEHLHVVVDDGLVPLQCWCRGADPANSFAVKISMKNSVDDLKNAISARNRDSDDLSPDLTLYKIPVDDEPELQEILSTMKSGQLLQGVEVLEKIFNDVPFCRLPRIVVEPLDKRISKLPPSAHRLITNTDPIMTARAAFLNSATKDKPSSTGTPSSFRKRQLDPRRCKSIPCGRPKEYEDTIPVTLLHTVFRDFIDDCRNIEVTPEDESFTQDLAIAMSALYKNESARVDAVGKLFQSYGIHFTFSETKTMGYLMDAHISFKEHHYVIAEFKNEAGNTSAEPHFQAIGYYLEATRDSALKFKRSPLPCLLLAIYGSRMEFVGATWNLRPTTQLLSTPIAFHYHSTDAHNHLNVSRHMAAFRKATRSLKVYYESLEDDKNPNIMPSPISATVIPPPTTIFPHVRNYKLLRNDTRKPFRYLGQLHEDKLVFSGIEDQPEGDPNICVKFVQTYNLDAHLYLAALGRAPAIRGYEMIAGGWIMVVMDMLPPDEFRTLTKAGEQPLPSRLFDDISASLASLHNAGFVHGDVRDTNIMVSKDDRNFKIIDFDWAGRIGQVRYPMNVNREDLWRPDDAVDRALITTKHDMDMLAYIVTRHKTRHQGRFSQ